ncbi:MAG: hypothetical protein K0R63_1800 [Rickettsiales bacterium]|jgi:prepilin-type N-terminal cleavage/methylation domain-containing protein|nr:hypothetical protein [Rickettsiales bacterium]
MYKEKQRDSAIITFLAKARSWPALSIALRPNTLQSRGFSLVELSAVLVIISVILGSAISIAVNQDDPVKLTQTQMKMQAIEEALAGFVAINRRLPCPASGTLALNHASFGLEQKAGVTCDDTSPYYTTSGRVVGGVVPIRTLQLPDSFMLDGWGNRITYAVNGYMARDPSQTTNFINVTGMNESYLDIKAAFPGSMQTARAAYVLVSHGKNGYGAWLRNGGSQIWLSGADTDEFENNHMTAAATITSYDGEFTQKYPTATFDDIVEFRTRKQLIREAGKVSQGQLCQDAENEVKGTASNCVGAANAEGCRTMAVTVYDLCLQ